MKFNKKITLGVFTNLVLLIFTNDSTYEKYIRTIYASTYSVYIGQKIFAIGSKT